MGAQRERITWRYELGAVVYMEGGTQPYTIEERQYTQRRTPPFHQIAYKLHGKEAHDQRWVYQEHIYPGPIRLHK